MAKMHDAVKIVVAAGLMLCGGCMVGPDFRRPDVPSAKEYTETALPQQTASVPGIGGAPQTFVEGRNIPREWWTIFRSEPLEKLIQRSLAESPSMAAAEAALRQARENLRSREGNVYYPGVDGNFSAQRQKINTASFGQPNGGGSTFTLYNASVSVSYVLDVFGGGRRELEGLRAQVDSQRYQLEGAHLTLSANIVTTAVREASLRAQIRTTGEIVASQTEQLQLVERQFLLGGVSQSDVLAQKAQLAQTRAAMPPLEKELAQTRNLLAVLSGRLPSQAELPVFELEGFQLPLELPLGVPSELAHHRPDIRAAEELLHAASAQVGVATANLYPHITLNASLGSNATRIEDLFSSGTSVWSLGAGLLQPIFRGGELSAKRRAAIAGYDQALAGYRGTVLQAFQDVADVLQALESDSRLLQAQAEAETSARDSFELTRKQFQAGGVSYISLLNAQRQYQLARIGLVQAQAARFGDTAALFQALGGGWWKGSETTSSGTVNREQ